MRITGRFTRKYHVTTPLTTSTLAVSDLLELTSRLQIRDIFDEPAYLSYQINHQYPGAAFDLYPGPNCDNDEGLDGDVTYSFEDNRKVLCFNAQDQKVLRAYNYNPYTGRELPHSVVRDLHITTPAFDLDRPCGKLRPRLSQETLHWLTGWMGAGVYPGQKLKKIPLQLRRELAPIRRCTPITVYRGISFNTQDQIDTFLHEIRDGYRTVYLTSWSTDKASAEHYSKGGVLLEMEVRPQDVLVDTNMLSEELYRRMNAIHQHEVVVLPGSTIRRFWREQSENRFSSFLNE
jgi:hypothetical protein